MLMHLKIASLKFIYSSFFHILKLGCIFIYVCIKICIQICLTGAFRGSPWPTHWHHAQLTPMYLLCSPEPILHGHIHAAFAARVSTDCNWNYKALTGFLHMPSLGIKSLFVPIMCRYCSVMALWKSSWKSLWKCKRQATACKLLPNTGIPPDVFSAQILHSRACLLVIGKCPDNGNLRQVMWDLQVVVLVGLLISKLLVLASCSMLPNSCSTGATSRSQKRKMPLKCTQGFVRRI